MPSRSQITRLIRERQACYTDFGNPRDGELPRLVRATREHPRSLTRSAATNRTAKGQFRSLHLNLPGVGESEAGMFGRQPDSGIPPKNLRPIMQVVVTLALLVPCLLVIVSDGYDQNSKHWAFGTVGTILGFWLKGGR